MVWVIRKKEGSVFKMGKIVGWVWGVMSFLEGYKYSG